MTKINELTTRELVALIDNKNLKILDVRPVDAYNGWKLEKKLGLLRINTWHFIAALDGVVVRPFITPG